VLDVYILGKSLGKLRMRLRRSISFYIRPGLLHSPNPLRPVIRYCSVHIGKRLRLAVLMDVGSACDVRQTSLSLLGFMRQDLQRGRTSGERGQNSDRVFARGIQTSVPSSKRNPGMRPDTQILPLANASTRLEYVGFLDIHTPDYLCPPSPTPA
jgi:hypothetical protein